MMRRSATALAALLTLVGLTVIVTWPQALHMTTRVGEHDDPLFSIWRLSWIAHALRTDPGHLFDANIFYPARNTLSFSDAMLLEGLLGTPLLWAGLSPVLVYNLLLFAGFILSGAAMFVLAKHVTGQSGPALVGAAIFTMAPYRVGHFMHLELQWTMWMPLALWTIHRAFERPSWRDGLLAGTFVWLQLLSSVYYGVFLAITCVVTVILMAVAHRETAWRAVARIAAGGVIAAVLALPYAWPYIQASRTMVRRTAEVSDYSANIWNYLASAPQSAFWGWTNGRFGGSELALFPGAIALVLAAISLFNPRRRAVGIYAILAIIIIDLSLGLNGHLYKWLFEGVAALHGLRSPARFGILASLAVAMLASLGAQAVEAFATRAGVRVARLVPVLVILVAIENATKGMRVMPVPFDTGDERSVYTAIQRVGPGPIIELPLPVLYALPGHEPVYMIWSIGHWNPLVNGYSGYYPPEFAQTVVRTEHFPDDQSIAQLRNIGVRYVVLHRIYYDEATYHALLEKVLQRKELSPLGRYNDYYSECALFLLQPT